MDNASEAFHQHFILEGNEFPLTFQSAAGISESVNTICSALYPDSKSSLRRVSLVLASLSFASPYGLVYRKK